MTRRAKAGRARKRAKVNAQHSCMDMSGGGNSLLHI